MMNMEMFNPFIRKIERRPELWTGIYTCRAYDYRIFFIESGSINLTINGEKYLMQENDMAIVPPDTPYFTESIAEVQAYVINCDLCFENVDEPVKIASYEHLFKKEEIISKTTWDIFPAIYRCEEGALNVFVKIMDIWLEQDEFYEERIAAMLKSFIIESMFFNKHDRTPELVKKMKIYLEENCEKNITNDEIGKLFSYHPNYINRIFKETTGETVHGYLVQLRLKKAIEMVLGSDKQIAEIGVECGFQSYPYFIKCFREKYGVSPLKYRSRRNNVV